MSEIYPERLQAFSDKHCRGKKVRFDLLLDMATALGLTLRARVIHPKVES